MKKIKLLFICVLCLCMVSGCTGSTSNTGSSNGKIRIYLTLSQADAFRTSLVNAALEEAEKQGVEIISEDAGGVLETQVQHIKNAAAEGYDVILCNPVNTDTALELEDLAGDIPIVFFNSCPEDKRLKANKYVYVGSNDEDAGRYQAEYILDKGSNKSEINVVIMQGELGHSATSARTNSLIKELMESGKNVNIVFKDTADWDQAIAKDMFNTFLTTNQQCDFVACNNDTMALGVIESMKENNISPSSMPVLGVDATSEGCNSISAGDMVFTVMQPAKGQGEYAIKAAVALAQGKSISDIEGASDDNKYIYVPFEKVTTENVSNYK